MDSKYASRQKWTQLLVSFYRRRRRGIEISLGEPFPESAQKPTKKPKNIARFALDVKAYLVANPGASYSVAAEHFNVSRARISQLMKISSNIPGELFKKLIVSADPVLLTKYSGKHLSKMASKKLIQRKSV